MNYVKKMCILRQIKQGFSGDGKALSGLIKIEQYGKNLAVEVSVINFAPLALGEYYCLLSDGKGKTEMLSLRGKSFFNILSDLDISEGFCGIICYVKTEVVPIAYGINGKGAYDWRAILNATLPPVFPQKSKGGASSEIAGSERISNEQPENEHAMYGLNENSTTPPDESAKQNAPYNDETVACENYFEKEEKDEQNLYDETCQNAHAEGTNQKPNQEKGADAAENGDAEDVLHPFKTDPDGYYLSVKSEIDNLFMTYPRDYSLQGAFSCGEWVRVKGEEIAPEYLVGVIYEDGRARYICYALSAKDKKNPPEEIKNVCSYVPCNGFSDKGFFVIFQSASTGECIKPERA